MKSQRAMVVEDDPDVASLVAATLAKAGFAVVTAANGATALRLLDELDPDLVTLDLSLPGMDGIEVCRRIREQSDCFVIILTARQDEIDLLIGLEVGADDYMIKPFSTRELRARVAALFRRSRHRVGTGAPRADADRLDAGGGLTILPDRREARVGDAVVDLTRTEFDLLVHLAARAGTVCSRAGMVQAIWHSEYTEADHLVEVHVANLRRKLRGHSSARWIHTVRGVGYRFDPVNGSYAYAGASGWNSGSTPVSPVSAP